MRLAFAWLRFRRVRWIAAAVAIPALWACNAPKLVPPPGTPNAVEQRDVVMSLNKQLDIVFLIDDSSSMSDLQRAMAMNLPSFMRELQNLPGGALDLHVGVVSSTMGAGIYSDV